MLVQPPDKPFTRPLLLTLATAGFTTVHATVFVMSLEIPLLNVAVAVNCCCDPTGRLGIVGVTASETTTGSEMARTAVPAMEPEVAEIVVLPTEAPSTIPAPFITPTTGKEELQL